MTKLNLKIDKQEVSDYLNKVEGNLKPKFNLPQKRYIKPNTEW